MKRREFLEAGIAAGAGMMWMQPQSAAAQAQGAAAPSAEPAEALRVALIGAGTQGRVLINAALPIPGVRFVALCDVWKYRRGPAQFYLKTYGHEVREYADYQEMLAAEKDLHAVLVATPDFAHAEQTVACLKAGLHVYCESMMSNSVEGARSMVEAMRQTGKLLAVGYQRRSNPRYRHVHEKLLLEAEILGEVTHAVTQWNHPVIDDLGWPKRFALPDDVLQKYGYANMNEFRNWRWFKRYSAGPFAGFAAHQVDALDWLLGAPPKAVTAAGGADYYKGHEWYDNVVALYEYPAAQSTVRASCQVITTSSGSGGNYEMLMGSDGSIQVSENAKYTRAYHEAYAPEWDDWVRCGYLVKAPTGGAEKPKKEKTPEARPEDINEVRARETGQVVPYDIPVAVDKPGYQLHLENFFDAVRGKAQLTCPADVAFPAEAAVLRANQAVEARKTLDLTGEDLTA